MKASPLFATLITTLALCSCDKNDTLPRNDDGAVRFSSGIDALPPQSRVTVDDQGNARWNAADPIGIYMVGHGTGEITDQAANILYLVDRGGTQTTFTASANKIYYPLANGAKVDFIAYHPHNAALTDFSYPIDLTQQKPQSAIDLMTARADNDGVGYDKQDGREGGEVKLAFTHRLVKLVMKVSKDASVPGKVTTVKIHGMHTTATFDLKGVDGLTGPGGPKEITAYAAPSFPGTRFEAILLPAALGEAHSVTFHTDQNEAYTWSIHNQIPVLEAGKMYVYTINVTKRTLSASGSIHAWTGGSTGTGTAE